MLQFQMFRQIIPQRWSSGTKRCLAIFREPETCIWTKVRTSLNHIISDNKTDAAESPPLDCCIFTPF